MCCAANQFLIEDNSDAGVKHPIRAVCDIISIAGQSNKILECDSHVSSSVFAAFLVAESLQTMC